ncbi:MAG: hypothetical protein J6K84_01890 [Oscillospiraceae bacterium]|nr:hypothetical protein [Oscillospiraceae bacterium]
MKRLYALFLYCLCALALLCGCNKKPQTPEIYTISYPQNLVENSLHTEQDGTVSFILQSPDGREIRFRGESVLLREDKTLTVGAGGTLFSMDMVGKIQEIQVQTAEFQPQIWYTLGYTFGKTSVDSRNDLFEIRKFGTIAQMDTSGLLPNFFALTGDAGMEDSVHWKPLSSYTVQSFTITYEKGATALKQLTTDANSLPVLFAGDPYDETLRQEISLIALPDAPEASLRDGFCITDIRENFNILGLLDENHTLLQNPRRLPKGASLQISLGDYTCAVPLLSELESPAQSYHELNPLTFPESTGELHALVIPIIWADHTAMATEEIRTQLLKILEDTTDDNIISLNEYFQVSSYGKLQVSSYLAPWYFHPETYSKTKGEALTWEDANKIVMDVITSNPQMDLSRFDKDGNGYLDAVIFITSGDGSGAPYLRHSNAGAYHTRHYPTECAKELTLGGFSSVCWDFFFTGNDHSTIQNANTLIHEFSHCLGVEDYYDTTYSGIDALGSYDMQCHNLGDWNPYSKLSAGWTAPTRLTADDFAENDSVTITLTSFAKTGACLFLPAKDRIGETPFGEYILVDFFTPHGVNEKDSKVFGLQNTYGVRIWHVNARYSGYAVEDQCYGIATVGNSYGYMAQNFGMYTLELIQAGGDNTFTDLTNLRHSITKDDFFYAGDRFTTEAYPEFFYQGKMDSGESLGYEISILEITEDFAKIQITRQ